MKAHGDRLKEYFAKHLEKFLKVFLEELSRETFGEALVLDGNPDNYFDEILRDSLIYL